jgi:hypothetical protein
MLPLRRRALVLLFTALAALPPLGAAAAAATPTTTVGYYCDGASGRACCPPGGSAPNLVADCPPCDSSSTAATTPSPLFGCRGELFSPPSNNTTTTTTRRLSDWSYAGYGAGGTTAPPGGHADPGDVTANVKRRYGARGDGLADDTPAFERFLSDVKTRAVLRIPPGRYVLRRPLKIRANVVLRGDGRERTFLVYQGNGAGCPSPRGADFRADFLLSFASYDEPTGSQAPLARVTSPAPKGANMLEIDDVSKLKVGEWVRLVLDSPPGDGSLSAELSGVGGSAQNWPNGPSLQKGMLGTVRYNTYIAAVEEKATTGDKGKSSSSRPGRVTLGRPLPPYLSIASLAWNPTLYPSWSSWHRGPAGVEGLTIEFPAGRDYAGRGDAASGCNAVGIAGTQHAYVKGVAVTDADVGVAVLDSAFVSIEDVKVGATKPRANVRGALASPAAAASSSSQHKASLLLDGAAAVRVVNSQDVLVKNLQVDSRYEADVAVQGPATIGAALASVSGEDLSVVLAGATGTLLTDVDFGLGTRPWGAVGQVAFPGPGAGTVVWNGRASEGNGGAGGASSSVPAPPPDYAALASVVGLALRSAPLRADARVGEGRRSELGWHYEPPPPRAGAGGGAAPAFVPPLNLLEAQRALRSASPSSSASSSVVALASAREQGVATSPAAFPPQQTKAQRRLQQPAAATAAATTATAATTTTTTKTTTPPPPDDDGAPYYCEGPEGRPCGCAPGSDEQIRVAYASSLPTASPGLRLSSTCGPCASPRRTRARPSRLYGCHGELWSAKGRLPDFSYAGFRAGDYSPGAAVAFASKPAVRSLVSDYGARGDGKTDDTPAFKRAEADKTLADAVLYLPAGRYVLKQPLSFRRPGLVIRGAGRDATTIYIPVSLSDVLGNKFQEGGKCCASDWSHKGAFLTLSSWDPAIKDNLAARISRPAARGDTRLYLADVQPGAVPHLQPGTWVRLVMDGDNSALLRDMSGGFFSPGRGQLNETRVARHLSRLRAVDLAQGFVEMERPLIHNVSLSWTPRLHLFTPQRNGSETGIEDLTIEFPHTPYPGHFKEKGYNAIHINQNHNSWVRNVRILNSDSAIYLWGSAFTSVSDVVLGNSPEPRGTPTGKDGADLDGHRGIWLEYGESNLVERFRIEGRFLHDLSVSAYETNSVFSGGYGQDLNVDFHRASPYANLFTDLDHGAGSRQVESGGSAERGGEAHAAALNTLWHLRGRLRFYYDERARAQLGPLFNFIAYRTNDSFPQGWNGWWEERLRPRPFPANLYESMRATRKARLSLP